MNDKFKVFISSRNDDPIKIGREPYETLSQVRIWLKEELKKLSFLDKDFLEIEINEDFGADASHSSYNECLSKVKKSDFLIALYNGKSGWSPEGIDLGICHNELSTAMDISTKKTSIINIEEFFSFEHFEKDEESRNDKFKEYIKNLNRFDNRLKDVRDIDDFKTKLLNSIKKIIYNHLLERIKISNSYYNLSADNRISLDWKKLKYTDRNKLIKEKLKSIVSSSPSFNCFISKEFSIPDNMSVEDAKSFTGRPFLKDQELVVDEEKYGPIHFIGVYGNATEVQVKRLIGFPDISVIRSDFGLYVWEQNTHVQMVFFDGCKTPEAIQSNFLLFDHWCTSTNELDNIKYRAKARFHILKAIKEAKDISLNK